MIAYAMNGEQLPLLNGFPLRLVVPGWYATYWVKMLNDIEVLDAPDENFWMKKTYLIPDTPLANIVPGQTGMKMIPITRMVPRSFVTNLVSGSNMKVGVSAEVRGIAFGGDCGVARVNVSTDSGQTWEVAELGPDEGKYGFRSWKTNITPSAPGEMNVMVRCTNSNGDTQPNTPNWNASGFMRNVVETVNVIAV